MIKGDKHRTAFRTSEFIARDGYRITQKGVEYLKPLIMGENYPKYQDGVPVYEQLDLHLVEI